MSESTPMPAPLLHTIPEVMLLLRLSRTQVFDEIRRGRIKSVKVGRARRIPAQSLTEFVAMLLNADFRTGCSAQPLPLTAAGAGREPGS